MGVDDVGGDPRRVHAGGGQHPAHRALGRGPVAAGRQEPLPHAGHGADHEVRHHPGVDEAEALGGQRGVDQHQTGHEVRRRRRGEGGDQPTEGVAHQDHRAVGHPVEEARDQAHVPGDVGAPAGRRGPSVPEQVEGDEVAVIDQVRRDGGPVEVGATEAVDGHHERAVGRAAVVDIVHRATDVDGGRHVGQSGQGRHPDEATGPRRPSCRQEVEEQPVDHVGGLQLHPVPGAFDPLVAPRPRHVARGPGHLLLGQGEVATAPHAHRRGLHRR